MTKMTDDLDQVCSNIAAQTLANASVRIAENAKRRFDNSPSVLDITETTIMQRAILRAITQLDPPPSEHMLAEARSRLASTEELLSMCPQGEVDGAVARLRGSR